MTRPLHAGRRFFRARHRYRIHVLSDLSQNPLLQYLARLAPSSQQTMRYILQDAADRLGFIDCNLAEVPWHLLEPGHVIGLVAALRTDGYAPNS
jgi:hypothetical protein